jgi:hypothetical protein
VLAAWNNQMNQQFNGVQGEVVERMRGMHGNNGAVTFVRCGNCGQNNMKEGRLNYVKCWNCTHGTFAHCRLKVDHFSDHYRAGGPCKQHA